MLQPRAPTTKDGAPAVAMIPPTMIAHFVGASWNVGPIVTPPTTAHEGEEGLAVDPNNASTPVTAEGVGRAEPDAVVRESLPTLAGPTSADRTDGLRKAHVMRLFRVRTMGTVLGIVVGLCVIRLSSSTGPSRVVAATVDDDTRTEPARPELVAAYGRLPLHFEANEGQADPQVRFLARGAGYTVFLTPSETVFALEMPSADRHSVRRDWTVVRLTLRGAARVPYVTGLDQLPGTANYFIGNDSHRWRSNIPTYARVRYRGVYPGVDLVYYGDGRRLEHDFIVAPGTDPGVIRLSVSGAGQLSVDHVGDLVLHVRGRELRLRKPLIYQEVGGGRRAINGGFDILAGTRQVTFRVGPHDAGKSLVIDPVLDYSTYLGGSGFDSANGIAVDGSGNAYVVGNAGSSDFPTANPQQGARRGIQNVFVTKLNATGSALVYSTYLGGSGSDSGRGIAVDQAGSAYVTGSTSSTDFPTVKAVQGPSGTLGSSSNPTDAFVATLSATGSALLFSTYFGGSGDDSGNAIAVDAAGNAYVAGHTNSGDLPTVMPTQPNLGGSQDAFVAKLNPAGSTIEYSTYLGGFDRDRANGIAVDASGSAYVTGTTNSTNFPTTSNASQPVRGGNQDAFAVKLDPTGATMSYSTYLGGGNSDVGAAIAVDPTGNAYLTGFTSSSGLATTGAFQQVLAGSQDAFVAKLGPSSALLYFTYLGGSGIQSFDVDQGRGIAVDATGSAYVTGGTNSGGPGSTINFPTVNPVQNAYGGGTEDAFVVKLDPTGSTLVYSTYLGGGGEDEGAGVAVDAFGNAYVTGVTSSPDFPAVNALQLSLRGGSNAFVAMLAADTIPPTTTATPSPAANANGWSNTAVTVSLRAADNAGGTGVQEIHFSFAGAQTGTGVQAGSTASIAITAEGITTLTYFAIDNAGNSETPGMLTIQIDETPPTVTCSVLPRSLWPPDHRLAPVSATVTVTDSLSGSAGFTLTAVTSSEPDDGSGDGDTPNDVQGFVPGTATTTGFLRAERSGSEAGRVYTLSYAGSDAAGNSATCSATVTVPHDQGQ